MNAMESTSARPPLITNITRFLIPAAALIVFAVWFSLTPPGLLGKADAIGYAICHRIDERSFQIGDRQLPLCARCTGEFYAAGISLLFFAIVSPKKSGMPGWRLGAPLLLFLAAFAIDGTNSFFYLFKQTAGGALDHIPNLYVPNNTLRLLTGSGMGIALASILYPAFNQSAWRDATPDRALTWKKLGILIGIVLLIDLFRLDERLTHQRAKLVVAHRRPAHAENAHTLHTAFAFEVPHRRHQLASREIASRAKDHHHARLCLGQARCFHRYRIWFY